jgi:hypothetical protein
MTLARKDDEPWPKGENKKNYFAKTKTTNGQNLKIVSGYYKISRWCFLRLGGMNSCSKFTQP